MLHAIRPVLKEVSISTTLGHIASGYLAGLGNGGRASGGADQRRGSRDAARAAHVAAAAAGSTMVRSATLAKDAILRTVHAGADKYVGAADNDLMLETAICEGYLDKAVQRLSGLARYRSRPYVLEWCVLKKHEGHLTLFYTKKDDNGFRGATKKARLARAKFDAKHQRFSVLVAKNGVDKKILHFRATTFCNSCVTDAKRVSVAVWWEVICPAKPGATSDWLDLERLNDYG